MLLAVGKGFIKAVSGVLKADSQPLAVTCTTLYSVVSVKLGVTKGDPVPATTLAAAYHLRLFPGLLVAVSETCPGPQWLPDFTARAPEGMLSTKAVSTILVADSQPLGVTCTT